MAYTKKYKAPPLLSECTSYESWLKEVKIWHCFNDTKTAKQGTELFMTLEGKSREAALQLDVDEINCSNGVRNIIKKLDDLYMKDRSQRACEAYHKFENFVRPNEMNIAMYLDKFEKLLKDTKQYASHMSNDFIAYRLLKSANLTEREENIIKDGITELSYENMKIQLKKIFGDPNNDVSEEDNPEFFDSPRSSTTVKLEVKEKKKSINNDKCYKCGLENHLLALCPYKKEPCEVILFQSHLINEMSLKHFVYEAFSSLVLDATTSKTVCGKLWLDCFLDSLSSKEKLKVRTCVGKTVFKFADGRCSRSIEKVVLPTQIGDKQIMVKSDVVDFNIPLLLSKSAMRKADTIINYENDTVNVFGETLKLKVTNSGHYILPVGQRQKLEVATSNKTDVNLILKTVDMNDKQKVARKLHTQFAHPSTEKLFKLINNAGYGNDDDLKQHVAIITKDCELCQKVEKATPLIGLPSASQFNEIVSVDIIEFENNLILHLLDHATRFTAASIIPSKEKDVVLKCIFIIWIKIFGPPTKYFSDNGCEFIQGEFTEMCRAYDIEVNMMGDGTTFSNSLGDRNCGVLAQTVYKTRNETNCDFNDAIQEVIGSNNALHNVHGFSPYQLVFGSTLPHELIQKTRKDTTFTLKVMKDVRKAFLATQRAEKLRRALRHLTHPNEDNVFFAGDIVFYKKRNSCNWKGPAKVLGQDGQKVLLKHHSFYVRCHPSRLKLENNQPNMQGGRRNTIIELDSNTSADELSIEEVDTNDDTNLMKQFFDDTDNATSDTSSGSISEEKNEENQLNPEMEDVVSIASTVDIAEETEKLNKLLEDTENESVDEEVLRKILKGSSPELYGDETMSDNDIPIEGSTSGEEEVTDNQEEPDEVVI